MVGQNIFIVGQLGKSIFFLMTFGKIN